MLFMSASHAKKPLKERIIGRPPVKPLCVVSGSKSTSRPSKYKAWGEENMLRAVEACTKEKMSVREAAYRFGVPKSTLGDRLSGRVVCGSTSGPSTYLDSSEEAELVQFLLRCSEIGYAKSRSQVLTLVRRVVLRKGIDAPVTSGWWESFCRRHPNLTLRAPAPLSKARSAASDPNMVDSYFKLLEDVLVKNDLVGKACQVFNMDESGMPLDPHVKCVTERSDRNPIAPSSGDKSQLTVVACVSASGTCLPPMIILDRKTLPPRFTEGEVPGTAYGLSSNGWIDHELFDGWFCNHFLKHAPLARPLLLLMDGHSSHYCPDTIRLAAKEQVILFALPPNTTHFLQPLDKGCFGPLKAAWKQECHIFMSENPGMVVTRYSFSKLFSSAWMKAMSMQNIVAGFRVCGIFPLNRDAIKLPFQRHSKEMESLAEQSGLAYIPLYSPARPHISTRDRVFESSPDCSDVDSFAARAPDTDVPSSDEDLPSRIPCQRQLRSSSCPRTFSRTRSQSPCDKVYLLQSHCGSVMTLLAPPERKEPLPFKSCGRLLTSVENLKAVEEKERAKKLALEKKEERKREMERRRQEKQTKMQARAEEEEE